jgi:hypothetical protein
VLELDDVADGERVRGVLPGQQSAAERDHGVGAEARDDETAEEHDQVLAIFQM